MSGQACANEIDVAFDELCKVTRTKLQSLITAGGLKDPFVYLQRIEYELSVFKQSGYSSILLIISDYIKWARANGVVVGPGRGSAAGSLVVYLAGITTIDPIHFDLIFERFLNPERVSLPDIDTDFSSRDAVVGYLKEKYGANRVVKVGVPSLFKPRSAIDEFSRELGVDWGDAKRINKLVGDNQTFEAAFKEAPELEVFKQQYPQLFDLAAKAQGYVRLTTTHPSAVILTNGPIGCEIPLQRARGEKEELVTQWDGEELDKIGFVKLDILTIDNLRIISNTIEMLPGDSEVVDFYNLPLDDQKTLDGFNRGETVGVFQLEEPKSVGILTGLNEITFNDIISVNACIRPGLDVEQFIHARNDPSLIEYMVPECEPILSETYGVVLFQEQVMRMCVDLAGFSMSQADVFRKIIAKTANQRIDFSDADHARFRDGYTAKGIDPNKFDKVWASILACQNYIFCKAHSVAYAHIAYADMYLKQHFPLQFMCACLQTRSREIYVQECARLGIKLLPPDVNLSAANYEIEGDSIRMGLSGIKHVGKAIKVLARRPYSDEFDFFDKAKPGKKLLHALVYGGAMDCFGDRSKMAYAMCELDNKPSVGFLAMQEKEHLGFYLVNNPLGGFEKDLKGTVTPDTYQPQRAAIGGMVSRIKLHEAKTGTMAFVTLLTKDGEIECIVWPSDYRAEKKSLVESNIVFGTGKKTEKGNYAIKNLRVLQNV